MIRTPSRDTAEGRELKANAFRDPSTLRIDLPWAAQVSAAGGVKHVERLRTARSADDHQREGHRDPRERRSDAA